MKTLSFMTAGLLIALGACAQDTGPTDSGAAVSVDAGAPPANAGDVVTAGTASAGKRLYIYCQACHTVDAGGMNKVGPNLHGFLNRPAGQVDGFAYSQALTGSGLSWTDENLEQWITAPSALVPGTTMVFAGIRDAQQRADLIAYLKEVTAAE